jgi:hypothetical protein
MKYYLPSLIISVTHQTEVMCLVEYSGSCSFLERSIATSFDRMMSSCCDICVYVWDIISKKKVS